MDIREVLALNLRKYRRAQRVSQEEVAHRAEIDRTYISSIERRVYAASIDVVDRLARALGVEAADLLRRPAVSGARSKEGVSKKSVKAGAAATQSEKAGKGAVRSAATTLRPLAQPNAAGVGKPARSRSARHASRTT